MFEKISKKFGGKVTDTAIEGAKENLNSRLDKYSDIIQIGLVIGVIALGGKMMGHGKKQKAVTGYLPDMNETGGSPIVINNYYQSPFERNPYRNNMKKEKGAYHGRPGKNY